MKLAVFSDMHGNLVAFEAMLADLETVGEVDMVWCLGDVAAFGPRPAACIQKLRDLEEHYTKDKFKVIGGNTDRYLVTGERFKLPPAKEEADFQKLHAQRTAFDAVLNWNLAQLSWDDYQYLRDILGKETSIQAKGYGYAIGYHGIPGDDESNALHPDTPDEEAADALLDREGRLGIGGHTHLPMDRALGRWRAVNIGSVGMSFDMPGMAQWGLFTFENGEVDVDLRAVPYDVDAVLADARDAGHPAPDWIAARIKPG